MRPTPHLSVKTGGAVGGGIGGRGAVSAVRPGGGGCARPMRCHWAVQREQNKDQTHSAPFNEACEKKKWAPLAP